MKPPLTADALREQVIYNPDTGIFTRRINARRMKAGSIAGGKCGTGYILVSINGKQYTGHRLAWLYVNGRWPEGILDHINRNRSDNRIKNLRESNKSENGFNAKIWGHNTSGVSGIDWHSPTRKWRARLGNNYLGIFTTKEDAISARNAAFAARKRPDI